MRSNQFIVLLVVAVGLVAATGNVSSAEASDPAIIVNGVTLSVGSQEIRVHRNVRRYTIK